ncbi:MAG: serine hydrolase domain-containing protein [Gemmatimonadota bacterium]
MRQHPTDRTPRLARSAAIAFGLVVSVLGPLVAQRPSDAALVARIDSAAAAQIAKGAAPALSIAVSRGGRTVYAKAFGMADLENRVPASPDAVFEIGSITKQFTSAAIMQLVDQGKVSLDDKLTKFFPDWPAPGSDVTVRELLNHTSGIKSFTSLKQWPLYKGRELSHDSLLALVDHVPFDFTPGTDWRYNNSGYYILGVIVEKLSGERYADYVVKHLAEPFGLSSTRYCESRPLIPHRARGYSMSPGGFVNAGYQDMSSPGGAGAVCSTARDLVAWTRALESGKVVKPESYRLMTTPIPLPSGKRQDYGFGLAAGEFEGHRSISHNGGIDGFRSQMASYPDDALIVAVLTNGESDIADRFEKIVTRFALGIPIVPPKDLPVTATDAERLIGVYSLGEQGVRVFTDNGRLVIQLPGDQPTRLLSQGGNRFVLESNPDFEAAFKGDGPKAERIDAKVPGGSLTLPRKP